MKRSVFGHAVACWMIAGIVILGQACVAWADTATPLAEDPVMERRLNEISEEMRCLVCQNESLAGSRSELAQDLRREIRTMIQQGKSNAEIRDFMVARYGDFVLYRPPVKSSTWLLWFGPFVMLMAAAVAMVLALRKRRAASAGEIPLTDTERERARALLASEAPMAPGTRKRKGGGR